MKKISLFLGCLVPNRYPGIEKATKIVLNKLNIEWMELKGASCCPAPGVFHSLDEITWLTIASRNIVLAEEKNTDILTICNGCFSTLSDVNNILKNDIDLKNKVNIHLKKIGKEFHGSVNVRHIIEFLYKDIGKDKIFKLIERPLDIDIAVHYGCHLLKPRKERGLGSSENPRFFDELVEILGAKSLNYEAKKNCCGAGGGVRSGMIETSLKMTDYKLDKIKKSNVKCIVDACPFCHMQFDIGQVELKKEYNIPVIHYTQLLALAMGYSIEDVGIHLNKTRNSEFENIFS